MWRILLLLLVVVFGAWLLGRWWMRRSLRQILQSPEFQQLQAARQRMRELEGRIREEADWFGQTGLPEDLERELPRYLRREFGETLLDPQGLRANDLRYCGMQVEADGHVHYWEVPQRAADLTWAYVIVQADGLQVLGWGNRTPPERHPAPALPPANSGSDTESGSQP